MQFTSLGSYSADDFPAEDELAEDELAEDVPADSDDLLVAVPEGVAAGAALDSLPDVCEWDALPVE